MAHLHTVLDDDRYFVIDPESRTITYEGEGALIITRTDHNSERFTFEIPQTVEGHDMSKCNRVEVHYINIGSGSGTPRSSDVYDVVDLEVVEDNDGRFVTFSWLLDQKTSVYNGSLSFAIRFACVTGTKIDYSWRTKPFSDIAVADTIDNADLVVTQYSDILQSWYTELLMSETVGVNVIDKARRDALESISVAEDAAVERIGGVEIVHRIEQRTVDKIEEAGDAVLNNIAAAEDSIVSSVFNRLVLGGSGYYVPAEEVKL